MFLYKFIKKNKKHCGFVRKRHACIWLKKGVLIFSGVKLVFKSAYNCFPTILMTEFVKFQLLYRYVIVGSSFCKLNLWVRLNLYLLFPMSLKFPRKQKRFSVSRYEFIFSRWLFLIQCCTCWCEVARHKQLDIYHNIKDN